MEDGIKIIKKYIYIYVCMVFQQSQMSFELNDFVFLVYVFVKFVEGILDFQIQSLLVRVVFCFERIIFMSQKNYLRMYLFYYIILNIKIIV